MKDLVSVIIVNWNGKKWLKKCLDSLRAQTYRNFEIILVDNASTDDSVEFVEKNYPEVVIVKSDKNLGFAGGNSLGIDNSRGEFILFLNNDIWVKEDFLQKYIAYFKRHQIDILSAREARYSGEAYPYYVSKIDLFGHPIYLFGDKHKNQESFYLSGSCLFFARSLYEETRGLDQDFFMYFEEIDWFWRLHLLRKSIGYIDEVCVYHAGAGSTGSGIKYKSFLWRNQNTLQMLLKNYAWYNLLWVLPIYFIQNIFEILAFLIFLKPRIAWSYIEGWWFNLRNLKRTLKKRRRIQQNRIVGDWEIMKKMYFGFGKAYHLLRFLRTEKI